MADPIARIKDALLGCGRARIAGPWIEWEDGEGWMGFRRYDTEGYILADVWTSRRSRAKWTLRCYRDVCPKCGGRIHRYTNPIDDPDTGLRWLSSSAPMDHADRLLKDGGWYLLEMEEVGDEIP